MFDIDFIAVPIDFSRSSRAALSLARSLAERGTSVEAVHVVDRWPTYMERVLFPYAPLGEDAAEIEHELVEAARLALGSFHEFGEEDTAPEVLLGPVKQTLVDHLLRKPSQLVVAGAFGEGEPMPDALGSVAERLLRSAGRPTLLVRAVERAPKIQKILVALDLAEETQRVFEVAARLAQLAEAELEVIHVVPDPLRDDHTQILNSLLNFDRRKAASRSRDRVEALFERLFREVQPAFSEEAEVRDFARRRKVAIGDPATEVIAHAESIGADTIVVGSQNPSRPSTHLGRVAATVARRAPAHVCLVPLSNLQRVADDG